MECLKQSNRLIRVQIYLSLSMILIHLSSCVVGGAVRCTINSIYAHHQTHSPVMLLVALQWSVLTWVFHSRHCHGNTPPYFSPASKWEQMHVLVKVKRDNTDWIPPEQMSGTAEILVSHHTSSVVNLGHAWLYVGHSSTHNNLLTSYK